MRFFKWFGRKTGRTAVRSSEIDRILSEDGVIFLTPGTYHLTSGSKVRAIVVEKGARLHLGGNVVVGTVFADGIVDGRLGK